jgi:hypothetical protein
MLSQTHKIRELFSDEVVPIIIAGNDVLRSAQAAEQELSNALLLPLELGDSTLIETTAKRSARAIWNHLTQLPYQFKGTISGRIKSSPTVYSTLEQEMADLIGRPNHLGTRVSEEIPLPQPTQAASMARLSEAASMDWDFDVFTDVLISLKSVLNSEQFELLSSELSAFSEEYRHSHYTACGLRVGRTLEHVVYALARAWNVNVNRTTLRVLASLDTAVEQLKQLSVYYAGSEGDEKLRMKHNVQECCHEVSTRLINLIFDLDSAQTQNTNVPVNVEAIVRDIRRQFAAREKVRRAVDAIIKANTIRQILELRNSAAHADTTGVRRELKRAEVDQAVELLRAALFMLSNVAFAVAEKS